MLLKFNSRQILLYDGIDQIVQNDSRVTIIIKMHHIYKHSNYWPIYCNSGLIHLTKLPLNKARNHLNWCNKKYKSIWQDSLALIPLPSLSMHQFTHPVLQSFNTSALLLSSDTHRLFINQGFYCLHSLIQKSHIRLSKLLLLKIKPNCFMHWVDDLWAIFDLFWGSMIIGLLIQ